VGLYALFPSGRLFRRGRRAGGVGWREGVGPDVSKTEGIKTSVAWVSPGNHAMTWCFRCVSGALRCRAAWYLG